MPDISGRAIDFFPSREAEHYVFASEKYGGAGKDFTPKVYAADPTRPMGDWKEAWEKAKRRSGVQCRFHDLRHTGCTRMLEGGVPYPVVAAIMGWSAATTIRMTKRYGHIGQVAQRQAIELLNGISGLSTTNSESSGPTTVPHQDCERPPVGLRSSARVSSTAALSVDKEDSCLDQVSHYPNATPMPRAPGAQAMPS